MVEDVMDVGKVLQYDSVVKGLRELNNDINFDVVSRRSSDWNYMFTPASGEEDIRKGRAPVYYGERYVGAIDRGSIPEIKIYGVEDGFVPIDMDQINKVDESKVSYMEVLTTSKYYHGALSKAQRGDDNFIIADDGRVFMYQAVCPGKTRGKVQKLGWRHTFEALLRRNIAGITRASIGKKFKVDMLRYPKGAPEEIRDALYAE